MKAFRVALVIGTSIVLTYFALLFLVDRQNIEFDSLGYHLHIEDDDVLSYVGEKSESAVFFYRSPDGPSPETYGVQFKKDDKHLEQIKSLMPKIGFTAHEATDYPVEFISSDGRTKYALKDSDSQYLLLKLKF